MNYTRLKKNAVLFGTFIVPLLFFLFLASLGEVHFKKLPVVAEKIAIQNLDSILSNKITALYFLDTTNWETSIWNLDEVVYKKMKKYRKFQLLVLIPKNSNLTINHLQKRISNLEKWTVIKTNNSYIPGIRKNEVTLIDEKMRIRSRSKTGGYHTLSVAALRNNLIDDLEVLFYEAKFAKQQP